MPRSHPRAVRYAPLTLRRAEDYAGKRALWVRGAQRSDVSEVTLAAATDASWVGTSGVPVVRVEGGSELIDLWQTTGPMALVPALWVSTEVVDVVSDGTVTDMGTRDRHKQQSASTQLKVE